MADSIASIRERRHDKRWQVGLREIAIVVRFFLGTHRERLAERGIPESRLLNDAPAVGDEV